MTQPPRTNVPVWRVSSYSSNAGAACVEAGAMSDGGFAVRDSKHRTGPALLFTPTAWQAFLTATKSNHFTR